MGFLDRLRQGLSRTTQQLLGRFEELVQQADTDDQRSRPVEVETVGDAESA